MKKIIVFLGLIILVIISVVSFYKYNLYEPYIAVYDYIQIKANPCEFVLNGETREFDIFYNEDEYGELTLDKISLSGATAKKRFEAKKNKSIQFNSK